MDGRGCEDYRCIEVETDVVSNTSGSARVKLVSAVAMVHPCLARGAAAGPSRLLPHRLLGGNPRPKPYCGRGSV